ncbi:disks large homolog 2-like isoform X2 [Oscarella lobularis]|uniref:disks large homolog 2-like isoform X2 n=1 Tax=Oscarella lobularis TaxID=121494 RepID=UPI00331440D4
MGDVRNWLRGELPRLLREIESLDLVLPYLKARGVLTDDDCADIRRENGAKASVELCLVRVFRQDASSLYHNFLVSLSLPYPRLYASLYRGMRSQFGEASVRGLPHPQWTDGSSPDSGNTGSAVVRHESRDPVPPNDEIDSYRRRIDTLTIEVDSLRTELASERSVSDGLREELAEAEHQYRAAKKERFEALDHRDRAISDAYALNDRLDEALRDNDELAAKNDGLNVQLRQLDDLTRERDEALADVEKAKRQRDAAHAERKRTSERLATTQRELETVLQRHEDEIREYERRSDAQKKLGKDLQRVQMEKMELQLENFRLRRSVDGLKDLVERTGGGARSASGWVSPKDSGKTVDMVKMKIVLNMMQQDDSQTSRTDVGIVLENGLYIRRLPNEGMAAIDGQLVVGDRLIEMNSLDLSGMQVEDVHSLIHACKSELTLTVVRAVMKSRFPPSPLTVPHSAVALHRSSTLSMAPAGHHSPYQSNRAFTHYTQDNLSLRSFAYNPNDRPRRISTVPQELSARRSPSPLLQRRRPKTKSYQRSISPPPLTTTATISGRDASSTTLVEGVVRQSGMEMKDEREGSLKGLSASRILRLNDNDTSDDDDDDNQPLMMTPKNTPMPVPSLAVDLASPVQPGMPSGGVSLTATDMRLATRGPDIIINPPLSPNRLESKKMPTFLRDPQMFSEKSLGGNVRFIELKASFVMSDIGFDIIGGRGWGVFVSRINCEEHEKAGLKIGDKILELNGISLENATYEKASATLSFATFGGGAMMSVEYDETTFRRMNAKTRDDFYIQALFDYAHPEAGEMAFREGDVLHVYNTMEGDKTDVWEAERCNVGGKLMGEKGSIPSKTRARLLHGPQLMKRNSSFPPPHLVDALKRRGSSTFHKLRTRFKPAFRRSPSHDAGGGGEPYSSLEVPPPSINDLGSSTSVAGPASTISSDSAGSQVPYENEPVVPSVMSAMALLEGTTTRNLPKDSPAGYQYVDKISYDFLRPVLLVGPLASVLVNRLSQEDPMKYCSALPEFIESYGEVENGLRNKTIIYSSQRSKYGASYSCITVSGIKQIRDENQHCLLDVGPECIGRLKAAELHPIVIFLAPKSEKKLRSSCMQCNIPSIEARGMYEEARHLYQKYRAQFTAEVSLGSLIERCLMRVRDVVQTQQNKVDWVPVPE